MDNQHRHIKGYRELTEAEIAQMNDIKAVAADVGALVDRVFALATIDRRWAAEGRTDLQKGFMSLVRAIAQPSTF
jgi:hypothetical protein